MGHFQVRYDSRVVNYDRKLLIRLATVLDIAKSFFNGHQLLDNNANSLNCFLHNESSDVI